MKAGRDVAADPGAGDASRGEQAFSTSCAACHFKGSPIATDPAEFQASEQEIEQTIRQGKGMMPAFSADAATSAPPSRPARRGRATGPSWFGAFGGSSGSS